MGQSPSLESTSRSASQKNLLSFKETESWQDSVNFGVIAADNMQIAIFLDVTPCTLL